MTGGHRDFEDVFPGNSAMSAAMRAHPWEGTRLGSPEHWPDGLKVPLRMMLTSRFEMWLGWGPDLAFFYNDAYIPTLGIKHPDAIGRPMRDVWAEVFGNVEDRIRSVMKDGVATWDKALMLLLSRSGYREETYHTFSYSPLRGDTAAVEGLMCVVTEETERVISERRLETLRVLATALLPARSRTQLAQAARSALASNTRDFPFSALHFFDEPLVGDAPAGIAWPMEPLLGGEDHVLVRLEGVLADPPCGAWDIPPAEALIVPIAKAGQPSPVGALVLGCNPYRREGAALAGYAHLLAGQIANALAVVDVHLQEAAEIERLRGLFQQSPSFMAVLRGPDYRFELANPSYMQLVGHRDVLGKSLDEALPEIREQGFIALLDKVYSTGVPFRGYSSLVSLQRTPGAAPEDRFLDFVYQPIWASDGTVNGVFVEGIDVTDAHHGALALADLNATLERQVEERTRELMLAEEALRQSQKMEAVGQLTGGIAHDFNNLLAGIAGSLELLQKRMGQGRLDSIPRYVEAAQSATKRAAALTQRLLAFSRRQTLAPKPIDINRLVGDMEELIRRTVGPSVEIEVVGAGGLWLTLVDPNQLENALLNLCINARDAMPDGGRLTIETANKWLDDRAARERDLAPGQYISLCVTDTGTGMTPEVIARAFDPFFTTKPLGQGTGLGLSMIYGFVRQSGGQVRIYSEVGQGTTMCLYLPRHIGTQEEDAGSSRTGQSAFDGQGETVLVIDDEPAVRMLIVDVLEEGGYRAIEAMDGPSGLKMLQSNARIDLMITDVGLPGGMNGRQVADAGRALRPDLKVLFVTGYAENAVVGNGHLDPGMQVITKPFAIDALGTKVREMLDK